MCPLEEVVPIVVCCGCHGCNVDDEDPPGGKKRKNHIWDRDMASPKSLQHLGSEEVDPKCDFFFLFILQRRERSLGTSATYDRKKEKKKRDIWDLGVGRL